MRVANLPWTPVERGLDDAAVRSVADPFLRKLGQRIRQLRRQRGWTQEDLAHATKIERAYISDIEHGRHNFGVTYLPRLAKALKAPVAALFETD